MTNVHRNLDMHNIQDGKFDLVLTKLGVRFAGTSQTSNTYTDLKSAQTAIRTITLPDNSGSLVVNSTDPNSTANLNSPLVNIANSAYTYTTPAGSTPQNATVNVLSGNRTITGAVDTLNVLAGAAVGTQNVNILTGSGTAIRNLTIGSTNPNINLALRAGSASLTLGATPNIITASTVNTPAIGGGYLWTGVQAVNATSGSINATLNGKVGRVIFTAVPSMVTGASTTFSITNSSAGGFGLASVAGNTLASGSSFYVQGVVWTAGVGLVVTVVNPNTTATGACGFTIDFLSFS